MSYFDQKNETPNLLGPAMGQDKIYKAVSSAVPPVANLTPNMRDLSSPLSSKQVYSPFASGLNLGSMPLMKSSSGPSMIPMKGKDIFSTQSFPPKATNVPGIREWTESVNYRNSFTSVSPPSKCFTVIQSRLETMDSIDWEPETPKLTFQGRTFSDIDMAEFAITIFVLAAKESDHKTLVEIRRLCGDAYIFQKFYAIMMESLINSTKIVDKSNYNGNMSKQMSLPLDFSFDSFAKEVLADTIIGELVQDIEEGYHDVCTRAACSLAVQTKNEAICIALSKIPNILQTFIDIIVKSVDALMVRSLVFVLKNMFNFLHKVRQEAIRLEIVQKLEQNKNKWTAERILHGGCVRVMKSQEIVKRMNECLIALQA